jgi:predicted ArsR family transcriptional regulator
MPSKPILKNKRPKITKVEQIINHLSRNNGASILELAKTTGWQAHSIRGFMSGALKKRGLVVVSAKQEGKDRRYMLKDAA